MDSFGLKKIALIIIMGLNPLLPSTGRFRDLIDCQLSSFKLKLQQNTRILCFILYL